MRHTDPSIQNVVATTQIECTTGNGNKKPVQKHNIDINMLNSLMPCCRYDKRKFAAITIKLSNPTCTALLFTSGKVVITGNKTLHESITAALFLSKTLRAILDGQHFSMSNCNIQNIVARADLHLEPDFRLDLDAIHKKYEIYSSYTKCVFPGLILRLPKLPVVLLCFESGKVVVTGGKKPKDIMTGWKQAYNKLKSYVTRRAQPRP